MQNALGPYPNSVQILLRRIPGNYFTWEMWQGPQGVAVNPCGDTRFKSITPDSVYFHRNEDYWHAPSVPRAVSWRLSLPLPRNIGNET
jgi:hypothetical protein